MILLSSLGTKMKANYCQTVMDQAFTENHVAVVSSPRQSGKTTFILNAALELSKSDDVVILSGFNTTVERMFIQTNSNRGNPKRIKLTRNIRGISRSCVILISDLDSIHPCDIEMLHLLDNKIFCCGTITGNESVAMWEFVHSDHVLFEKVPIDHYTTKADIEVIKRNMFETVFNKNYRLI